MGAFHSYTCEVGAMRKGMTYTTFAVLGSAVLLSLMVMPYSGIDVSTDGDAALIGQASFYHDKIHEDKDRAFSIAFDRAMSGVTSYMVSEGVTMTQPRENISHATVNASTGQYDLQYMENASMGNWGERIANASDAAGYGLKYSFENQYVEKTGSEFEIRSNITMHSTLRDPSTQTVFNQTSSTATTRSIEGLEDPMLRLQTGDFYGHLYERCGFTDLSQQLGPGTQSSGSLVWGEVSFNPVIDGSTQYENSVIVSEDLQANYDPAQTQGFEAAISASEVDNPGDYNDHYLYNVDEAANLDQNQSIVVDGSELYSTRLREMVSRSCYMESDASNLNGPDFFERLQNDISPDTDTGLVSLVNKTELQTVNQNSNVDYVYFSDDPSQYGNNLEIRGVTFGDSGSDYLGDFRLDQHHVDHWDLNDLAE